MKPFDDHFVAEYEFPPKPDGTLQALDLTCQECNRFFRHYIEHKFGRLVSKPDTAICSDCMKGLPYETKKLRHVFSQISKLIETPGALTRAEFDVIYKGIMIFSKDA